MLQPTSLRLPESVKERLEQAAARRHERPSAAAVRLIDEGVRMADHPGIVFHDSAAHGRVASLTGGPDIAEVMSVLSSLEARGEERVAETAEWLGIHRSQVRTAMGYYATYADEIDQQIERRQEEAEQLRTRSLAEQALLE